jgi:hypothetical protein
LPTCRSSIALVSHVSASLAHATAQANRGKPARHCEAHSPAGERHGGRASRGRGRHGNEGPGGATAGDGRKMSNEPAEGEPIDRARARLEALLKPNAAPRCGARSKRTNGRACGRQYLRSGTWAPRSKGPRGPGSAVTSDGITSTRSTDIWSPACSIKPV